MTWGLTGCEGDGPTNMETEPLATWENYVCCQGINHRERSRVSGGWGRSKRGRQRVVSNFSGQGPTGSENIQAQRHGDSCL